jgi:hypothetical protein
MGAIGWRGSAGRRRTCPGRTGGDLRGPGEGPARSRLMAAALAAVANVAVPALAAQAGAQTADGPTIAGSISGRLLQGNRVTFRLEATSPRGYRDLHSITVALALHDVTLEELEVDLDEGAVMAGGGRAVFGTANVLAGTFFEIRGFDVSTQASGQRIALILAAKMRQDVPPGGRFVLTVLDDRGEAATVERRAQLPQQEEDLGLSWGALLAAAAGALLVGGFLGDLFASHRRPAPRPSVYDHVRRRIERDRASSGSGPAG